MSIVRLNVRTKAGFLKRPKRSSVMMSPKELRHFFSKVKFVKGNTCWFWMGTKNEWGYGYFKGSRAHRFIYSKLIGKIPIGLTLDHKCRARNCVNPLHLRPMTLIENMRIGNSIPAINARKTHCKNGHEFTKENTQKVKTGRRCAICFRKVNREFQRKKRRTTVNI